MSGKNFNIICARVSFKNIPLHKMEKYSFTDIDLAHKTFKEIPGILECIILQTASRVEVYVAVSKQDPSSADLRRVEGKELVIKKIHDTWKSLTQLDQFEIDHLDQTLEIDVNLGAYQHLLQLSSGTDSLIIGQEYVLEKIQSIASSAKQTGISGDILDKLFESTIRIGKKIRESTGINKAVTSVGDVAVRTADERVGLEKKQILLIGTGETAYLVANALSDRKCEFSVTSRNLDRATGFSKTLGGTPIELDQVFANFAKFDIIFVATTSTYFIINYNGIKQAMDAKKTGTLVLDVSDPRSVDEEIAQLPGIKLMFRDQIGEMDQENQLARKNIIPNVEKMILKESAILAATINRLNA